MTLKPWYQVVYPREDLRENRPLDAAEFAVHLDQVRDGHAPGDYQDPARFFSRTYLTGSLTGLAGEVLRRLAGERTETSAVFNMEHPVRRRQDARADAALSPGPHGPAARSGRGSGGCCARQGWSASPRPPLRCSSAPSSTRCGAAGGDDGTPLRKTPWGEIAFQLGGAEALAVLAEHEAQFIEPTGDVIRRVPAQGSARHHPYRRGHQLRQLRNSGLGYRNRIYNFLQTLSETRPRPGQRRVGGVDPGLGAGDDAEDDEADEHASRRCSTAWAKP